MEHGAAVLLRLEDGVGHHALREERVEGFGGAFGQVARLDHRAGEEAGIEQVQDRMLDAADILVDIHPVIDLCRVRWRFGPGRGEAGVVPTGIHEGVHRVRLALGHLPARRAGHVAPRRMTVQRVARDGEIDRLVTVVIRQLDRQIFFLFRHHATISAVHDRDRAAPVALARETPIAEAELHLAGANALCFGPVDGGLNGLLTGGGGQASRLVHPAHTLGFRWNEGFVCNRCIIVFCKERVDYR